MTSAEWTEAVEKGDLHQCGGYIRVEIKIDGSLRDSGKGTGASLRSPIEAGASLDEISQIAGDTLVLVLNTIRDELDK